jgi:hypothetical protein
MTWPADLREQVLEEFREAQRRRGELAGRDEKEPESVVSNPVEKQDTAARPRRIVRRAA